MRRDGKNLIALLGLTLLSGCDGVLNPQGPVGVTEARLIAETFGVMLIVVIPVIFMALYFPWKYRASNRKADYRPEWSFSLRIEIAIWAVPLAIVAYLGWAIWRSTLELDPYKPLDVPGTPLEVDVVALDWKWLFIYPQQRIASVNHLVIPAGRQISFRITSDGAMNAFFIPALGTQIYAMAGMDTQVHLMAKNLGDYPGISANFSGPAFADMRFDAKAVSPADFETWVGQVQHTNLDFSDKMFQNLAGGTDNNPPMYFKNVDPDFFSRLLMVQNGTAKPLPNAAKE